MTQTRGDAGVGAEARERTMRQVGTAVFWGLALSGVIALVGLYVAVVGSVLVGGAGLLAGAVLGILVWLAGVAARAALDRR